MVPLSFPTFKLGTTVVLVTVKGGVPVATVEVNVPEVDDVDVRIVNVAVPGVTAPIVPGADQSLSSNKSQFKFVTFRVENAAVAFNTEHVRVVAPTVLGVTFPRGSGTLHVLPFSKSAFKFVIYKAG